MKVVYSAVFSILDLDEDEKIIKFIDSNIEEMNRINKNVLLVKYDDIGIEITRNDEGFEINTVFIKGRD